MKHLDGLWTKFFCLPKSLGFVLTMALLGCDEDPERNYHAHSVFVQFTPGRTFKSMQNIRVSSTTHRITRTEPEQHLIYECVLTPNSDQIVFYIADKEQDASSVRVEINYRSKWFLNSTQTYIQRIYEICDARSSTDQPVDVLHTELSSLKPRPDVEVLL